MWIEFVQDYRGIFSGEGFYPAGAVVEVENAPTALNASALIANGRAIEVEGPEPVEDEEELSDSDEDEDEEELSDSDEDEDEEELSDESDEADEAEADESDEDEAAEEDEEAEEE